MLVQKTNVSLRNILKGILNKKKRVFYRGTTTEKKQINMEVKNAIRQAKKQYKNKIESKFTAGNFRSAWQGIKNMAAVNKMSDSNELKVKLGNKSDQIIADDMNAFFTRFEKHDFSSEITALKKSLVPSESVIVDADTVVKQLKKINVRKSPGPDSICGKTLRCCANQLGCVLQHLFQLSLDLCSVPKLWKTSTIIPLPKITKPKELKDFRPIALTSLIMKTFEKIVKSYILPDIEQNLDPLQFAYRAGKGVDDAKLFILNTLYKHLETPQSHARLLFADFSSAFNVMQPHILVNKLVKDFALDSSLVLWILDFLINRPQRVFVNSHYSNWKYTNTGSLQGCCLSPLIFIIYTDSFRSNYADIYLVKFADDTALLSLLNGSEQGHGSVLNEFEMHCDQAHLELNVLKTKELIVDFRKK